MPAVRRPRLRLRRDRGRWQPWLQLLTVFIVLAGIATAGSFAVRGFMALARGNWQPEPPELDQPPLVTYAATESGGRLTLHVESARLAAELTPDRRELRVQVAGARNDRYTGAVVADSPVRAYEVLEGGRSGFSLVVHLEGYGDHELINDNGTLAVDLFRSPLAGRRIVLDPGHGGRDPGCVSPTGLLEAQLTLPVAEHLQWLLEISGAEVRLTRDAETDWDLYSRRTMDSSERIAVANAWPADVFVSIHFNSFTSARYHGTEVWHYPGRLESRKLAGHLMEELAELGLNYRGVKSGDFAVTRMARVPAVLVELGFLSNEIDEAFFADPANLVRAAELFWRGLESYFAPSPGTP